MIRLILLRHGNTFEAGQTPTQVGVRSDLPLTIQGCEQAEHFARYLIAEAITPKAIFAGTLKRQIKTAQIIAKQLFIENLHLHEPALTEIDYGAWEGLTSEEIQSKWPLEYDHWTEEAKWAEGIFGGSLENHLLGIKRFLDHLKKKYASGDTIAAVTSNGLMRFFYSFQKTEWEHLSREGQLEKLKVKTGHFCELHIFNDFIKIKSWNQNPQHYSLK